MANSKKNKSNKTLLESMSAIYAKMANLAEVFWMADAQTVRQYEKLLFELLILAKKRQLWRVRDICLKLTDALTDYAQEKLEREAFDVILTTYQQAIKNYLDVEKLKEQRKTLGKIEHSIFTLVKRLLLQLVK